MELSNQEFPDMSMRSDELYREEVYSDRQAGSIRCLIPVNADGSRDEAREVIYGGQTQLMTQAGALPISFEIEATSIGDASSKFGEEAEKALENTLRELEEMRKEAASSILVPGAGGMPSGNIPPGSMGGGKIQLP